MKKNNQQSYLRYEHGISKVFQNVLCRTHFSSFWVQKIALQKYRHCPRDRIFHPNQLFKTCASRQATQGSDFRIGIQQPSYLCLSFTALINKHRTSMDGVHQSNDLTVQLEHVMRSLEKFCFCFTQKFDIVLRKASHGHHQTAVNM